MKSKFKIGDKVTIISMLRKDAYYKQRQIFKGLAGEIKEIRASAKAPLGYYFCTLAFPTMEEIKPTGFVFLGVRLRHAKKGDE